MERIELAGAWTLARVADGSRQPMAVPGDLMSALIASGELPDPYFDRNELSVQWVGREDWRLEREFDAAPSLLERKRALLVAEQVDTVADFMLNGVKIGSSDNMFRRVILDATCALVPGRNRLEILIKSPEKAALEAAAKLAYPVPWSIYPVSSPHRNLVRKAQCMSGWDWGPCLMTGGVYDGIALLGLDGPLVEWTRARTRRDGDGWTVEASVGLDSGEAGEVELEFSVAGVRASLEASVPAGRSTWTRVLRAGGVEPWWPVGYGGQTLHDFSVAARPSGAPRESGHEVRKRIGFRELAVRAEEDPIGRSFAIVCNGREIWAKGANWIPADALPSRWKAERIRALVDAALEANMNCLRVWGGGRYESDAFYDYCDEKGVLVWQDFMFSCALYPSGRDFLARVDAEARFQVRRLADHPSIALWCGNNEALGAIGWYPESKGNPARYIVDYDRLNEGVLGKAARELDPDRTWWPSSPSAGPDDFSDNWHADARGDMHYWSVWHEGKPFSAYLEVAPRFVSEFGFQSLPSLRTARSFAPPGQLNPTSPAFEHHQRHERGNALILATMARYFRMPSGFEATLYLSQVQQALAIRTAVEWWRSLRPRCMGALYWQLNDVWPVASWSGLEYDLSPRLLHREARRFFDPTLLAVVVRDGVARVVLVEDGAEEREWTLRVELRRLSDGASLATWSSELRMAGESARVLKELPLDALRAHDGTILAPETVYLAASIEEARRKGNGRGNVNAGAAGSRDARPARRSVMRLLVEPKRCELPDPRLSFRAAEGANGPELVVRAEAPAFWVEAAADALPGHFDDAGFDLEPGGERTLRWIDGPGAKAQAAALEKAVTLRELRWSHAERA